MVIHCGAGIGSKVTWLQEADVATMPTALMNESNSIFMKSVHVIMGLFLNEKIYRNWLLLVESIIINKYPWQ